MPYPALQPAAEIIAFVSRSVLLVDDYLLGLSDRATALGGRLTVESPPGGGTRLAATLPLEAY
jgi:signal transduction histidine kinase